MLALPPNKLLVPNKAKVPQPQYKVEVLLKSFGQSHLLKSGDSQDGFPTLYAADAGRGPLVVLLT